MNVKKPNTSSHNKIPCWINPREIATATTQMEYQSFGAGGICQRKITIITTEGRKYIQSDTITGRWMSDEHHNSRFCSFWSRDIQNPERKE